MLVEHNFNLFIKWLFNDVYNWSCHNPIIFEAIPVYWLVVPWSQLYWPMLTCDWSMWEMKVSDWSRGTQGSSSGHNDQTKCQVQLYVSNDRKWSNYCHENWSVWPQLKIETLKYRNRITDGNIRSFLAHFHFKLGGFSQIGLTKVGGQKKQRWMLSSSLSLFLLISEREMTLQLLSTTPDQRKLLGAL